MTRTTRGHGGATLLAVMLAFGAAAQPAAESQDLGAAPPPLPATPPTGQKALDAYGTFPLAFVPNAGQTDPRVRYSAQTSGASFYFTPGEAVFAFRRGKEGLALRLAFPGANAAPQIAGAQPGTGSVNYLVGSDRARWRTGVPTYGEVVYKDLWPGIDLAFRGERAEIKYEFRVAPGADPRNIRLAYRGADRLSVDADGDLLIHTALGVLRDSRPVSYQTIAGGRVPVASRYAVAKGDHGFALGDYDRTRPLIIDPALAYSTLLGGSASDPGTAIAIDGDGNAYVTGATSSTNFPTTTGAFDETHNAGNDVFVTKLNATGTGVIYSTYIGGNATDDGHGIAVDAEGNAYVTGVTTSTTFPTTPGAFDLTYNGGADAFVTKLDANGSVLLYSTYLGGSVTTTFGPGPSDAGVAIAVDASGSAYVTGNTASANFPTTPGAFDGTHAPDGSFDAFVTRLNAAGSALVYSTFLGGAAGDAGTGIAIDAAGHAYVTGHTQSRTTFPMTPGAWKTTSVFTQNVFVTKLNTTGSALVYSTFAIEGAVGGGIAADTDGHAYVTAQTTVANQATPGAFDTTLAAADAFVTKLNELGSARVYATYLGGAAGEDGQGIAVDAAGNAYVTGLTNSADFPTSSDAFDRSFNGGSRDVFVTQVNAAGSALLYSTYLGGPGSETGNAIAVDAAGSAYVTGTVTSSGFPTTAGAFDRTFAGTSDAFVAKFELASAPAAFTLTPEADANPVGTSHTVTATVEDANGQPVENVIVRFAVTGSVTESGSCTTDANGQCPFTYQGPTAPGMDDITAFADTDGDGAQDPDEPGGVATKTWVPAAPATVMVTPATDTNPVGTSHTVTASVTDAFANPVPGVTVRFAVSGSVSASGQCATDMNGQCSFAYQGPTSPGSDAIAAFADTNGDGVQDPDEPAGTATKTWVPGAPASVVLTPATDTNPVGTSHTVTAWVTDAFANPVPGVTVRFAVTGSVSASGQCATGVNGQCSFAYQGPTSPGSDVIAAFADTNGDGVRGPGEPSGAATKTWVPGAPATVTVMPAADTKPVGTEHCVTATVTDAFGNPVPGVTVRFTVVGSVDTTGSDTTDGTGRATFCYMGPELPGADEITAHADTDGDGTVDAGEPVGGATNSWLLPDSTPGHVTGGGQAATPPAEEIAFGFNARSSDGGHNGHCNVIDRAAGVHIRCLDVTSLVLAGTHATIFGNATINGVETTYRIDVDDIADSGAGHDRFEILTESGYTAGGVLTRGNIQTR